MSLVFDQIQSIPQTHVFIIGIGDYPYLKGGAEADENSPLLDLGLGQLTSPPQSAKVFYEKILELHHNNSWVKPLGSIELLLSSQDDLIPGQAIERATLENIKSSYYKWRQRCESSKDNVTFFFFCGHGLEKVGHYLLAEDFGKNSIYPWDAAFAFDLTRSAFHKCRANAQIFLVDACRQITNEMLLQNTTVSPLENPDYINPECAYNTTIKATANSESAYGRPNQASFFTQAILRALDGHAAIKESDLWVVSTGSIAANINQLIRSVEPSQNHPQRCYFSCTDSIDILRSATAPNVDLEISCNPETALAEANLFYRNLNSGEQNYRDPAPDPWIINVEAGIYELAANFNWPPFNTNRSVSVMPPFAKEKLNCL